MKVPVNLRFTGDGEEWETMTTEPDTQLHRIFNKPGVRAFTNAFGILYVKDDNQ